MSELDDDVESEVTQDPWSRNATTTARYDLCSKCEYYVPQKPYQPGIRCRFGLRPDVDFIQSKAVARCDVFKAKNASRDNS